MKGPPPPPPLNGPELILLIIKILKFMANRRNTVAFIHPDLGIGGAEQLIINMALALQEKGYHVKMFTPHFDP